MIKGLRLFRQIYLFLSIIKNNEMGLGVMLAPEYKSEHFCTRDVFIHVWKWQFTLWIEDASV
jgi:hypothetical protein